MRFFTNPGNPVKTLYGSKVLDNGSIEVVITGKMNLDEYIQSFEDSCNINVILARFANGDSTALNAQTPIYGDFTGMPKTYAEMLQKVIDGQRYFETLPIEIKQKFNNDFNQFFAESGETSFLDKLGFSSNVSDVVSDTVDNLVSDFTDKVVNKVES